MALAQDGRGRLWVGTWKGANCFDGDQFHPIPETVGANVWDIIEDRQGRVWLATLGSGVICLDGGRARTWRVQDGLPSDNITSVLEDRQGHIWLSSHGGVCRYDGETFTHCPLPLPEAQQVWITAIYEDRDGVLWIISANWFICYDGQRFSFYQPPCALLQAGGNTTVYQDRDGDMWFGNQNGLVRRRGEDFTVFTTRDGLAYNYIISIYQDRDGYMWFGTYGGGLSRYDGRHFQTMSRATGLPNSAVQRFLQDERGDMWIATEGGLTRFHLQRRPPAVAILGYAQLLLGDEGLAANHRERLEIIDRNGANLLALINEVLDISRIETGRLELQETDFDLSALVRELAVIFQLRCQQKGLQWHVEYPDGDVPQPLRGDAGKMRQILTNLLSNAVKFTHQDQVILRLDHRDGEAPAFAFAVIDTGSGIAAEDQQAIFEPFQRGDDASSEGSGLGLAIAHRLIEFMGGRLQVESALGAGARFYFDLSFKPTAAPQEDAREARPQRAQLAAGQSVKVLVADDLPANRAVLAGMLEKLGCQVILAADGRQAVALYRQQRPDLVFMDIRMPQIDGRRAARQIWATSGLNQAPIIAISASALVHERQAYLDEGFAAFVAKPYRFEEISQCLASFLRVEFTYDAGPAVPVAVEQVRLPADLLAQLRHSAALGEVTELEEALEHVRLLGKPGERLAARLATLSRDLDMDSILHLLDEIDHEDGRA